MSGFHSVSISSMPLEDVRDALDALYTHLDLRLEARNHYSGREYRAAPIKDGMTLPDVGESLTTDTSQTDTCVLDVLLVVPVLLKNRQDKARGHYLGFAPGHGGDVWIVQHEDGTTAAYLASEVTLDRQRGL